MGQGVLSPLPGHCTDGVVILACEIGYEDYCDRLERRTSDDSDEADRDSDWASRLSRCEHERGDQDMDTGFDNEATELRSEQRVYAPEAGGAELVGGAKIYRFDPREDARVAEAVDAISFLHPDSIAKMVGGLLAGLPMEQRATLIAEALLTLDYEQIGYVTKDGLVALKTARKDHAERLKALQRASLEAECALAYALQGAEGVAE